MPKKQQERQPLCSTCVNYQDGQCELLLIVLVNDADAVVSACTHYTEPTAPAQDSE